MTKNEYTKTYDGEEIHPSTDDDNHDFPPLVVSYNDKIRPILDAVDKLRRLNITQEGIPLPTIVVVGDQSSGKSSVLESLAGISLPRGQDICTRVPLIMRLQHHPDPVPEFILEYQKRSVKMVEESEICDAIRKATVEIAGNSKGISNVPLTLVVKKQGVPDLTMVDLPGITRVPVGDQPDDIYEQISGMIMEYIKPDESIILNVLSASVDFTTCESICMSRRVDTTGQRTLAVVTKCDRSPDGLLEKVTTNEVNIGLGYICVRNRINDETYEEARNQEATLFKTHPLLSKIDKSMVGIPVLAHRLVHIQSVIISKCLPEIIKNINERLNASVFDLNKLPRKLKTIPDAMVTFMQIVGSLKETLQKMLIQGEFDEEYENENEMHCDARLAEMVDELTKDLQSSVNFSKSFLVEEMKILEEANGIRLPNLLPRSIFLCLLKRKVNAISDLPVSFVNKVWDYLETICARVLMDGCGNYPQLLPSMKKATQHVMGKLKAMFLERVGEIIEMEKMTDYTCDPDFITCYNKLMSYHAQFSNLTDPLYFSLTYKMDLEGYGLIDIEHLRGVAANTRDQAFDLKMRMTAYWNIVLKRMVDCLVLQLRYFMHKVVSKEMEIEIVNEVMVHAGGIDKMLDEPPYVAKKRDRLQTSISLLKESKDIIEHVMDGYESEDSSANEVNLDSSGSPTNEDDSEGESYKGAIKGTHLPAENRFETAIAKSKEVNNDAVSNGVLDCVLKIKSVFKCKLCPRIVCLNKQTLQDHLKSKRHAQSEKLLKEGRLKMMLNSDGEIEELEEDGITHQERHAATLALAESTSKKSKGKKRQKKLQKTSDDGKTKNKKESVKRLAKKRRKSES